MRQGCIHSIGCRSHATSPATMVGRAAEVAGVVSASTTKGEVAASVVALEGRVHARISAPLLAAAPATAATTTFTATTPEAAIGCIGAAARPVARLVALVANLIASSTSSVTLHWAAAGPVSRLVAFVADVARAPALHRSRQRPPVRRLSLPGRVFVSPLEEATRPPRADEERAPGVGALLVHLSLCAGDTTTAWRSRLRWCLISPLKVVAVRRVLTCLGTLEECAACVGAFLAHLEAHT